jgi:predicted secreted hydrolase
MKTAMPDQELKISFRYYEGSIIANGIYGDEETSGRGYVEMTGYNSQ